MANPWESAVILRDKQGAPIPQLWDSSQNKFIPYEGKNKLYGPDGNLISTENPLPVQLSGSKVVKSIPFNATAMTTVGNHAAPITPDLVTCSRFIFIFKNTHDQYINLRLLDDSLNLLYSKTNDVQQLRIPANTNNFIMYGYTDLPTWLQGPFYPNYFFNAVTDVAPTSGAFTMTVIGQ